ncbi:MAG: PcfJ domain-containing protein [Lewinellaceae bacterium]|nr:PcfJ domain-containing protein [Saprospiraceae bacterium]MCB9333987.1 PcfJ domain-containing protein [Lewinellaceae bacterium]
MTNRTARLRREQEAYALECLRKEAFRKSKHQQRLRRSAHRLQPALEQQLSIQEAEQSRVLRSLLRRKSTRETFGSNHGFFLAVLHCLGSGQHWRDLNSWHAPRSRRPARVFDSLARHVFIKFPLPPALYRAVLKSTAGEGDVNYPVINWFLHVAAGDNLSRAPGLPFEFTKKAAHFLEQAPEELGITKAMRWAQVRAMGGGPELALAFSHALDQSFGDFEAEWSAVIRFVVRYWKDDHAERVPRIVDFVRHQRLEPLTIELSDVKQTVEPLYPGFDIRQASEQSLLHRMQTWEAHVKAAAQAVREAPFPRMGLEDCYQIHTAYGPVRIQRLKNIMALLKEGKLMRHCVGGYGVQCRDGYSSIWSIQMENERRRLATIQLGRNKQVLQFRGKANSQPGPEAKAAVSVWMRMPDVQRL